MSFIIYSAIAHEVARHWQAYYATALFNLQLRILHQFPAVTPVDMLPIAVRLEVLAFEVVGEVPTRHADCP